MIGKRAGLGMLAAAFLLAGAANAGYLRVTQDGVNIRTSPRLESTIVTQARRGDVFELEGTTGNWYEISMFGGEYRYIHRSLAQPTSTAPALPASADVRRSACFELVRAQDRAVAEAEARYPTDFRREIDFERFLYDRYELPVFHKYGLAPARNARLAVECAKKNWLPE